MKKTNQSTGKIKEIIINKLLALLVRQIPTDSIISPYIQICGDDLNFILTIYLLPHLLATYFYLFIYEV